MNEPSIRNVALLPVVAVVAGGVFVLSTVVGQGVSDVRDCGPGSHSMAAGETAMGGMDHGSPSGAGADMGAMDHSAHLAMGSDGCMGDDAMGDGEPAMGGGSMPAKDKSKPTEQDAPSKSSKHSAH